LDHLFDEFFATGDRHEEPPATFAPRANLAETDTAYEVTVDVPGMKPDELDLEFKDNRLSITGERKKETEDQGTTYHRVERHFGKFRRLVSFDAPVDADKVEAEYADGVLKITVPKSEEVRPRRIEVKS
jgi:HSP20 family protein